MKLSAILAPMIAAGVSGEVILATVKAFEDQQNNALEKRRESDRKRQAKHRDNVMSRDVTVTVPSREGVTRVEDNLQTKKISGEKENKKAAALSDLAAFKADLESDCSPEQVDAFAKHRKAKSGQNSAYSAKLFRRDAAACGLSLPDAIDIAMSRNWLTVKPEYLQGRPRPHSTASPPRERTVSDVLREISAGTYKGPPGFFNEGTDDGTPTIEGVSRRN